MMDRRPIAVSLTTTPTAGGRSWGIAARIAAMVAGSTLRRDSANMNPAAEAPYSIAAFTVALSLSPQILMTGECNSGTTLLLHSSQRTDGRGPIFLHNQRLTDQNRIDPR